MSTPTFSDFTVHVFINHDPFIATVLLPDLFSEFSDSIWRLPQNIATPPRPEVPPNPIPQSLLQELLICPRSGLGRYVFSEVLPYSTSLHELSQSLEHEFGLDRKLLAKFTIFPQGYLEDGTRSKWHNKPLPWNMTLGEVAFLDGDAVATGQYAGIADEFAPVLHLVIETKAAALQRCLGAVVDEKFMAKALGDEYKHRSDMWSQLAAFTNSFPPKSYPKIENALQQWRSAFYTLRYLEGERAKLIAHEPVDENSLQEAMRNIEEYQDQKMEAKFSISALASQWEEWVLKQDYSHHDHNRNEELRDNEVEDRVLKVLRQRIMVFEWGKSEKKQSLLELLQSSYFQSGKGLNFDERQQPKPIPPESINSTTNKLEEQWELVAKGEAAEQSCDQASPDACPIKTLPFRLTDGSLNHELAKFTVKSGILSWGQILPIYYGSLQEKFTNNAVEIVNPLPGGTIRQNVYTYKSAARAGDWKVRRYYGKGRDEISSDPDAEKFQAGWIVCHDDIDPMDIVQRVSALGSKWGPGSISNGNEHTDKDILYIGRYDWGYHWHSPQDRDFEDKFYDWAKIILDAHRNKEVRPFPKEMQGRTQDDMIEEKQDIALELHHKLEQVLLNPKRPPKDDEIPLMAEYLSRLEQLPDSATRVFRNSYMHNILQGISSLGSIPRDDEFGIKKRAGALNDKWRKLLIVDPISDPWYPVGSSTGIAEVNRAGYFIAMDSEDFDLDFIEGYKSVESKGGFVQEVTFSRGAQSFGTYVSFPRKTADEFAWLVFSGKRHAEHDADELIAIVYDGIGEVFQSLYHTVEL